MEEEQHNQTLSTTKSCCKIGLLCFGFAVFLAAAVLMFVYAKEFLDIYGDPVLYEGRSMVFFSIQISFSQF
jgi:hypothetical protein